jgi:hypothetical protein
MKLYIVTLLYIAGQDRRGTETQIDRHGIAGRSACRRGSAHAHDAEPIACYPLFVDDRALSVSKEMKVSSRKV